MAIVDGPLFTAVRAKIDAEFGPIPPEAGPGATVYRDKLARLVMFAAQYVRDNGEVAVGITVDPGTFVGT